MTVGCKYDDMVPHTKTRDLALYDYFNKLQEEYVVAELRKRIYPKIKDKKYWSKVMSLKKNKIEDIVLRNCLHSIFNNEKVKEKIYTKIYTKTGLPKFIYRDEGDQQELENLDIEYYYTEGSFFNVYKDDDVLVGKLKSIDFLEEDIENNKANIVIDNEEIKISIKNISRIL